MKKKEKAAVLLNERLAENIYSIWLEASIASDAKSGQFILVYPKDSAHLLGRPLCVCEVNDNKDALRIVFRVSGAGTESFAGLKKGDEIFIEGPLGNGYDFSDVKGKRAVLLGGGIGAPALLMCAKELHGAGAENVTAVLGYRDGSLNAFLSEDFKKTGAGVMIATDDGSLGFKGNVIDAMRGQDVEADVIYACGPMVMLKAIGKYAEEKGIDAYISLEERMACGVGACLGCVVKTVKTDGHSHVKNARICTEGPVFLASEVAL